MLSHSVVSDSLQPPGLLPIRLLCPWDSPDKNTGVGCHALLQGIFPAQDQTQVSCIADGFFTVWVTREAQLYIDKNCINITEVLCILTSISPQWLYLTWFEYSIKQENWHWDNVGVILWHFILWDPSNPPQRFSVTTEISLPLHRHNRHSHPHHA